MMTPAPLHRKLERLVGERFLYLGEAWCLIEILGELDSLVLRRMDAGTDTSVQVNSYGHPNRRASETLTLAISDREGSGYSDEILCLLEGRLADPRRAVR
jgi:hypothetical protein